MTKGKLKELYNAWNKEITLEYQNDNSLDELEQLCSNYGDGHAYGCYEKCLIEVIKGGDKKATAKALLIYNKHIKAVTRNDELMRVAIATDNFNI